MKIFKAHTNQTLFKHLTYFVTGSVLGVLLFTFLFYNEPDLWMAYNHVILGAGLLGVVASYLLAFTSRIISKWTSWDRQPGLGLFLSLLINSIILFLLSAVYVYGFGLSLSESVQKDVYIKLAIVDFIIILIYSVISLLIRSNQLLQQSQLDSVKLETRQIDLQLTALKAQLTPHFLFNSLNTISSLLHKDVDATEQYIRNLASVYQYTLPSYEKRLVTFEEEWSFVKANVELIQVRFGGHLAIDLDQSSGLLEVKMPPLTLQLLLENALKHNQIDEKNQLDVKISRSGKWWSVSNNLTRKPNQVESFQVGLGNIKERYQLLGNKQIQVTENERFTVKLPVL